MLVIPVGRDRWDYSLLQASNPFWSLAYLRDSPVWPPSEIVWLLIIVPSTALLVFLLNLPGVAREVRQVWIAKPKRVAEEDAEKAALKSPLLESACDSSVATSGSET